MEKHRVCSVAIKDVAMVCTGAAGGVKDVAKQLLAKLPQEILFCFKMGVEGRSAHIGAGNDFANGYLVEILLGE